MAEAEVNVDLWEKLKELLEVKEPDLEEVKDVVSRIGNKQRPVSSWSPMITAVRNNQVSALNLLVKSGFPVNDVLAEYHGMYGWCAVGAAIEGKNFKLAKHLVDVHSASPNSVWSDRQTLLTAAITMSDWPAVKLLLEELGANPNTLVHVDSQGGQVSPIHLAMWHDFYRRRNDWKMTKLLLKNRVSMGCLSDWVVFKGRILLGTKQDEKRNATSFAETLKEVNEGRMEEKDLDCLVEMLKEEMTIQECHLRIRDNKSVNLSALANLNNAKTFFSSPLVSAAKHGRFDLVELMVRTLGYDVNSAEESTGLSPLAAAVESGNKDMVRYLVKETGANVDALLELELVPGQKMKCTCLAVAINQGLNHPEMVRLLVEELGADVNPEVQVDGKPTTLLHHAINCIQDQKSTKILASLLAYGAKADQIAWTRLTDGLCQVSPVEQALCLQARSGDDVIWYDVADKMTHVLLKEETEQLKKMAPEDLVCHSMKERLLFEWHQIRMKNHLEILAQKVEAANLNSGPIIDLKSKEDYMTEEELAAKDAKFWQKVAKSKAIEAEIRGIIKHGSYLTEEKLEQKKAEPDQTKKTCYSCEKMAFTREMMQCFKKGHVHIFCTTCAVKRKHCAWCQASLNSGPSNKVPLIAMTSPAEQGVTQAEMLLEKLKTLRESKDLLSQEELEILTRKHEADIERATILNKLISSFKKVGDPDFSRQLEESYKALKGALGSPYPPRAKPQTAEPGDTNTQRIDGAAEAVAGMGAGCSSSNAEGDLSKPQSKSLDKKSTRQKNSRVRIASSAGDRRSEGAAGRSTKDVTPVSTRQSIPIMLRAIPEEHPEETLITSLHDRFGQLNSNARIWN